MTERVNLEELPENFDAAVTAPVILALIAEVEASRAEIETLRKALTRVIFNPQHSRTCSPGQRCHVCVARQLVGLDNVVVVPADATHSQGTTDA